MKNTLIVLAIVVAFLVGGYFGYLSVSRPAAEPAAPAELADIPTPEPTAAAPTATAEPTPAPSSTPEPTLEPTAEPTATAEPPTLEEIIAQAADTIPPPLLPDFVRDAPTHIRQDILGGLRAPVDYIMQELYLPEGDRTGGAAMIYLYENDDDARQVYTAAALNLDGMGYDVGLSNPDVGERAKMEDLDKHISLAFARCNAFVFVWTTDARPFDVQAYATRLDELIRPLACEE